MTPDAPYRHDVITLPGRRLFGMGLGAVIMIALARFLTPVPDMKILYQGNLSAEWDDAFRNFDCILAMIRIASAAALLLLLPVTARGDRKAISYFMLVLAIALGWTISASNSGGVRAAFSRPGWSACSI